MALAEAVREDADPHELTSIALRIARGDDDARAMVALQWLRDSGYVKPAERHEFTTAAPDDGDEDLDHLSVDQLRELAELDRRRDELLGSGVQDPTVLDDDTLLLPAAVAQTAIVPRRI